MNEVTPLYIIAACAIAMAIMEFVALVLLVSVRRGLKRRDRARGEVYAALRYRIHRVEDYLIKHGFRRSTSDALPGGRATAPSRPSLSSPITGNR
jgi:hypothetical protein